MTTPPVHLAPELSLRYTPHCPSASRPSICTRGYTAESSCHRPCLPQCPCRPIGSCSMSLTPPPIINLYTQHDSLAFEVVPPSAGDIPSPPASTRDHSRHSPNQDPYSPSPEEGDPESTKRSATRDLETRRWCPRLVLVEPLTLGLAGEIHMSSLVRRVMLSVLPRMRVLRLASVRVQGGGTRVLSVSPSSLGTLLSTHTAEERLADGSL